MSFTFAVDSPWLIADFSDQQKMLSWSLTHPGFTVAKRVAWLQVRDADLDASIDAGEYLRQKMTARKIDGAVGLMTSRDIKHHHFVESRRSSVEARCLTTLGLNNACHVASPEDADKASSFGTINTLCHVSVPLSDGAMIEASSIVTQARTAAVIECNNRVTGTGTDCIVVASPLDESPSPYAGLHTDVGKAIGEAVYQATLEATKEWLEQHQ